MFRWLSRGSTRTLDIVVVSSDEALVAEVERAPGEGCRVVSITEPAAALAVLGSRPVHGAVVDGALPGRMAQAVSRAFLQHQPIGHVVILAAGDDPSSLIGSAYLDQRVELLFRPLDAEVLRQCLLGVEVPAAV